MTRNTLTAMAFGLSVLLAPMSALASNSLSAEQQAAVTEMLVAQGYEVRKLDMEDGMIEAYVLKDGQRYEIYVGPDMKIAQIKAAD
jgi:hypothetical protein